MPEIFRVAGSVPVLTIIPDPSTIVSAAVARLVMVGHVESASLGCAHKLIVGCACAPSAN